MKNSSLINEKNEIKKEIKASLNLIESDEYKTILRAVCETAAEVVTKTLGPYASTTVLDDGTNAFSTKDGWTVLDHLLLGDPVHSVLYNYIKRISFTLNSRVGDGTTTALVVANHFIQIFDKMMDDIRMINPRIRQAELIDGIEAMKDKIIAELNKDTHKHVIEDTGDGCKFDEIYNIAYISSNGNAKISETIREIYEKTHNPNIHVTLSDTDETSFSINRGYKLDCHLLWAPLYLRGDKEFVNTRNPRVYMFDHMVKYNEHYSIINDIIQAANNEHSQAIIFAPSYDDQILSALGSAIKGAAANVVNAGDLSVMLFQLSLTSQALKNYAADFAVLTNSEIINYTKVRMFNFLKTNASDESVENYESYYGDSDEFRTMFPAQECQKPSAIIEGSAGRAPRLTVTEKYLLLEDYSKDSVTYQAALAALREDYNIAKEKVFHHAEVLEKDYMESHLRLIKFIGDTGVIYVGGDSELKRRCTRDAVLDATLACRSAYENGYIRGFNLETMSAIYDMLNEIDGKESRTEKDNIDHTILRYIGEAFMLTSIDVMLNKFRDDSILPKEYIWNGLEDTDIENVAKRNMHPFFRMVCEHEMDADMRSLKYYMCAVFEHAVTNNLGYNIVTEEFEPAGQHVINSIATDTEILRATTSIITMLLSSNQLLSINKRYDKKINKEIQRSLRIEDAEAQMTGFMQGLKKFTGLNLPTISVSGQICGHLDNPVDVYTHIETK